MVLSIVISFRKKTDTVPHACNSRTWEIEAGRSEIQGHHQLCTRDMSQEKKKKGHFDYYNSNAFPFLPPSHLSFPSFSL